MGEIALERMAWAIETTALTAEAAPTRSVTVSVDNTSITPIIVRVKPDVMNGTFARNWKSKTVARRCEWTVSGHADLNMLYDLMYGVVEATPTVTTPGTLADLAVFTPDTSQLKSFTLWFLAGGLSGTSTFQIEGAYIDELTFTNDGGAEDTAQFSVSGTGKMPTVVAAPSWPALADFPALVAPLMDVWIDTGSAIGTTAVTNTVASVEHTFSTGISSKRLAAGASASLDYQKLGRAKRVGVTTTVLLEYDAQTYYNQFTADDVIKLRVRHNGPLIETNGTDYYHYFQVDTYGPWESLAWETIADSNRGTGFTIESHLDDTLTQDYKVDIQTTDLA